MILIYYQDNYRENICKNLNGCSWVIYSNFSIRWDCNPINITADTILVLVFNNLLLWILKYLCIEYKIYLSKINQITDIVNNWVIISNNIYSSYKTNFTNIF